MIKGEPTAKNFGRLRLDLTKSDRRQLRKLMFTSLPRKGRNMTQPVPPPPRSGPEVGDKKMIMGVLHAWNGTEWIVVPQPILED